MPIDPRRHLSVFSPDTFGSTRIDVIGVGATGSHLVCDLAKLGIENIHVWDYDKVEPHNVANTAYGAGDIGKLKTRALETLVRAQTGLRITIHNEEVERIDAEFGTIIFLLVDSMAARRKIWESGLKLRLSTDLVIETRMGADHGRVYAFNPSRSSHISEWEATLCDDATAEEATCGARTSVGPTAKILAGWAVWQMMRWCAAQRGDGEEPENELMYFIRPPLLISRAFGI